MYLWRHRARRNSDLTCNRAIEFDYCGDVAEDGSIRGPRAVAAAGSLRFGCSRTPDQASPDGWSLHKRTEAEEAHFAFGTRFYGNTGRARCRRNQNRNERPSLRAHHRAKRDGLVAHIGRGRITLAVQAICQSTTDGGTHVGPRSSRWGTLWGGGDCSL